MIQAVKRSPLDLRPLLGITPAQDSATIAHALSAYCRMPGLDGRERDDRIRWCLERLSELRSSSFDEPCWGYHFDVETRFFPYPRGTPNTIATAFAGLALLDAHDLTESQEALELAEGAGDFFIRHVGPVSVKSGRFFGYFPGDTTAIHNANLLACGLLARLAEPANRPDFAEAALEGMRFALDHQREDGSWAYAEGEEGDWVDNLHTGYVLDSLQRCCVHLRDSEAAAAWRRGLTFFADRLFLENGAPRFSVNRTYPIDGQCAAQAIQTFAVASRVEPHWLSRAGRVLDYALSHLRMADGSFIFQRGRVTVNRTPHPRWVQAPMLDALTRLWAVHAA